jgi:hypothetical protein
MSDKINPDGVRYVPANEAAASSGISRDHVSRLARSGKVRSRRVGNAWFVDEASLAVYLDDQRLLREARYAQLSLERSAGYSNAISSKSSAIRPAADHSSTTSAVSPVAPELPVVGHIRTAAYEVPNLVHRAALAPMYSVSPIMEYAHRLTALVGAIVLVFGTYALVDGRFAMEVRHALVSPVAGIPGSAVVPHVRVEGGGRQLASAHESAGSFVGVRLVFSEFLARIRNVFVGDRASIVIDVRPVITDTGNTRVPSPAVATPVQKPGNYTVVQPVRERIVERERVVVQPVSDTLGARLAEMDARLTSRILELSQRSASQITQIFTTASNLARIEHLDRLDLTEPRITGGTITNATISGGSVTATDFSGTLGVSKGGTGTSTAPSYGNVLIGDGAGGYRLVATSSLGIIGAASSPGGSSGNLQYNSGGVFGGASALYYDAANGRFGIGTSSPYTALGVSGQVVADSFIATSTTATSTLGSIFASALRLSGPIYDASNNAGTNGYVLQTTGTGVQWVATSSLGIVGGAGSLAFGQGWEVATNVFGQSSLTPTTTKNIAVSGVGTSTFAGGVEAWRSIAAPYFVATSSSATSTFANGINVTDGCFAVDGVCMTAGGSGSWGSITGALSSQTDLNTALNARLTLADWYATTTDILDEGTTNLYFTNARSDARFAVNLAATTTTALAEGTNQYYTLARFATALAGTTTTALAEGNNLYFTSARATSNFVTNLAATTSVASITSLPNLSTIGTITSGTWQGSVIGDTYINDALTISGGTINNTPIGASTPSTAVFTNATATNATTTNLAISGITSSLLKTNASGSVIPAIAGTDYANFQYLFPSNATTTSIAFNGGLTGSTASFTSASSTNLFATNLLGNIARFGQTATTTIDSSGNLTVAGNTSLQRATSTQFAITGITNALLGTRADGSVYATTSIGGSFLNTTGNWTGTFDGQEGTYYLDRTNHTGTQLASTISDFSSTARGLFSSTFPIAYNSGTGAFTWNGLTTSTPATAGNLTYFSGVNTLANVATSSLSTSAAFSYSGTFGSLVGGTGGTLSLAANGVGLTNLAQIAGNTILGNISGSTGNVTAFATSSLGVALTDTTGTLAVTRGGTGITATPSYGQILVGNAGGTYTLTATSSLGLPTNADLNNYLSLSAWYATTTDILDEGTTNLYFTSARATSNFVTNLAATTSVASITSLPNLSTIGTITSGTWQGSVIGDTYINDALTISGGTINNTPIGASTPSTAVFTNATATNATTTNLAISGITSSLLKTNASGSVIPAIAGTDYANFQYLFPSNATTTSIAFNGGLTGSTASFTSASSTNLFATNLLGNIARFGQTATSTFSSTGQLTLSSSLLLSSNDAGALGASGTAFSDLFLASEGVINWNAADVTMTHAANTLTFDGAASGYIFSNGNVGIATTTPGSALSIQGNIFLAGNLIATSTATSTFAGGLQTTALNVTSTTATSTFANGIQLSGGCFRDASGSCLSSGSGSSFGYLFPNNATSTTLSLLAGLNASSTIRFGNAGLSQFLFDSSTGRLGIGTSTPWADFAINSTSSEPLFISGSGLVTTNLETPSHTVRYANRIFPQAVNGASESAGLYFKVDPTGANNQIFGIYGELTANQEDTEAGVIRIIHYGQGDAIYNAIFNTGIGVESAIFQNGGRGFLGSIQDFSSAANSIPFVSLWATSTIPGYGGFYASESPARGLTIQKFATSAPDGFEQIRLAENNLSRNRFAVYNSGTTILSSLVATSGLPIKDSPDLILQGSNYYYGSSASDMNAIIRNVVTATSSPEFRFLLGTSTQETIAAILRRTQLDLQGNNLVNVGQMTYSNGSALTLTASAALNQNLQTVDTPTFFGLRTTTGNVGIGTTTPGSALSIQGNIFLAGNLIATSTATSTFAGGLQTTALNVTSTTATSTFANGIQLSGGCFRDAGGACIGSGGIAGSNTQVIFNSSGSYAGDSGFTYNSATDALTLSGSINITGNAPTFTLTDTSATNADFVINANNDLGATTIYADANGEVIGSYLALGAGGSEWIRIEDGGDVGIGETNPGSKLAVSGEVVIGTGIDTLAAPSNGLLVEGAVGIGTTTPFRKLSITDAVSTAQQAIAYDTTRYTDLLTNSVGDFIINPQGDDAFLNDDNLWVCAGGSCPAGTPSGNGNLIVETRVGIGTSSPNALLSMQAADNSTFLNLIAGGNSRFTLGTDASGNVLGYTGNFVDLRFGSSSVPTQLVIKGNSDRVGIGTTTPTQQLSIADRLYVGAGGATGMGTATSTFQGDIKIIGKLDVSTIDPPFTIDGTKYATFVPSATGVKEETMMTIQLDTYNAKTEKYETTIRFDELKKDSDLWLFYQVTDFGEKWEYLVVQLTPSFDGQVFYKKDIASNSLTISGTGAGEVSMRLTGNRYDHEKWTNKRPDNDGDTAGTHVISPKLKGGDRNAAAASAAPVAEAVVTLIESIKTLFAETLAYGLEWLERFFTAPAAQ